MVLINAGYQSRRDIHGEPRAAVIFYWAMKTFAGYLLSNGNYLSQNLSNMEYKYLQLYSNWHKKETKKQEVLNLNSGEKGGLLKTSN